MKHIIFISDMHLGNNDITQNTVIAAIQKYENTLSAIYLLGDIFNVWIGDEQIKQASIQLFLNYLLKLSQNNIKIYIMHGNRDFLIGNKFCQYINASLLSDPYILILNQQKILLTHGDLLCTDDRAYQKLRKVVHNKIIQKLFLCLPYCIRLKIATSMRKASKNKQQQNNNENYKYIDINEQELEKWHIKYNFDVILHGHTHKTNTYQYNNYTRLVLSDWHENKGVYAIFNGDKLYLENF